MTAQLAALEARIEAEHRADEAMRMQHAMKAVDFVSKWKPPHPATYEQGAKMKIQITALFSGSVLFEHEAENNTVSLTLVAAVKAGANLAGAYLGGANLGGANLGGANLGGAYLDGEVLNKAPISLINLQWSILITGQYMRIGCQRHTHEEWRDFTDAKIRNMAIGALAFWREWKAPLLAICHANHEGPADAPLAEKVVA